MTKVIHLDYETRSRIDLTEVGAHRYAIDPSTEVFMAAVSSSDSDHVYLWINPAFGGDAEKNEMPEVFSSSFTQLRS